MRLTTKGMDDPVWDIFPIEVGLVVDEMGILKEEGALIGKEQISRHEGGWRGRMGLHR